MECGATAGEPLLIIGPPSRGFHFSVFMRIEECRSLLNKPYLPMGYDAKIAGFKSSASNRLNSSRILYPHLRAPQDFLHYLSEGRFSQGFSLLFYLRGGCALPLTAPPHAGCPRGEPRSWGCYLGFSAVTLCRSSFSACGRSFSPCRLKRFALGCGFERAG